MFADHQPIIGRHMRRNPDNFFQGLQFVLLTIQQSLYLMPQAMDDVNKQGLESNYLWGVKARAWRELSARRAEVYEMAMLLDDVNPNPDRAAHELLSYFASLPGLGLVKGGFVAQLGFGLCGCLDTHNANRFGLVRSQLAAYSFKNAKRMTTKQKKVSDYLSLCNELGGCEGLWNSWCEYVYARNDDRQYTSADHVSAMHCQAMGLS